MKILTLLAAMTLIPLSPASLAAQDPPAATELRPAWLESSIETLKEELVERHGPSIRPRLVRGLNQVASLWRTEDGDAEAFASVVRTHFVADPEHRSAMFARFEEVFEQLDGLMLEAVRRLRMHMDVDKGDILPFDELLAAYQPSAHLSTDLFENKVAFVVLLNFPLTTLEERLEQGPEWSRREWAEVRLAQRFGRRIPAEVHLAIGTASAAADSYISGYNIWMHHLLNEQGERLFPAGMRLISHWNLRDELKANYGAAQGLEKQRVIQQVMERIVTQTIPAIVIDNPRVDWNPVTNEVRLSPVVDGPNTGVPPTPPLDVQREEDQRYETLLSVHRAVRLADPYSPTTPTAIDRQFDEAREIPEERVRAIFESVLASPLAARVASLIESRLGRPLEPFDIWYDGFKARGAYSQEELDALVAEKYPTAQAFENDIPRILRDLGFTPETAEFVAANVEVHPSRGAGHAFGAGRRGDKAFLRTRVEPRGMNYKGYNIAVHELGHNVEQVLSLNRIDHPLLEGVPNNAFTEALAFVFQDRDLELLGLHEADERARSLATLDDFWNTFEIAGVSLVDVDVWHWMYANPNATPAELREAVLQISRDVWNRYYAPVLGGRDVPLLGIYSHMISYPLYLADYPLGHTIAFQINQQIEKSGKVGPEFSRMATIGNVTPDLWMRQATGSPVGAAALLEATRAALDSIDHRP